MAKGRKHTPTLFARIALPLVFVVVALGFFYYGSALFGGLFDSLNTNSEDVLEERVSGKQTDLQNLFVNQWADLDTAVSEMDASYKAVISDPNASFEGNDEAQKKMMEDAYPKLVDTLRTNGVTGVFLILNDDGKTFKDPSDGVAQTKPGICVRDYDPSSSYIAREDLLVTRCPSSMISKIGCSIDSSWEANYTFEDEASGDYFYEPIRLAYENPDANYDDLAYFAGPHASSRTDHSVVSYSVPLVDDNGVPYGVVGIELTVDYLKTMIPTSSLYSTDDSCYALVQYEEGSNSFSLITANGALFQQAYGSATSFSAERVEGTERSLDCQNEMNDLHLRAALKDITIYNHNTPFESQKLALVGLVKEQTLYSMTTMLQNRLILTSLIMILIGIVAVFFVCRRITTPITALSNKVREMDDDDPPTLDPLDISEIDDLVYSIEDLSNKVNRNMVRTEFFSRMSHDMRTPMNAVIGFSSPELTKEADLQAMRGYMDKIHMSGTYLLGLINEVLDMTKIEAERMELRIAPIGSRTLWEDPDSMIGEYAHDHEVKFVTDFPAESSWVMADRQRVSQIFMNLLSNAVKFTDKGGTVTFTVETAASGAGKRAYRIIVADSGSGMTPEFMEHMYEPFVQETPGEGGTGLGLAITKQIVDLMNGTIECVSKPGEGTTFTVNLSFDEAPAEAVEELRHEQEESAEAAEQVSSADLKLKGKHVLLCEDHPMNAQLATMLLERKGMIVDVAVDGRIAVTMFADTPEGYYDVILMDIRMPNMNGLEATRAIRELPRRDATTIPIIAMTANAFDEDVEQSRAAGMNAHLSKPIDPTILYVSLEKELLD